MADIDDCVRKALESLRNINELEYQRDEKKYTVYIRVTDAEKYRNELQEIEDCVDIVKTNFVDEGTCIIVNKSTCSTHLIVL